jgi:hypothetical protein
MISARSANMVVEVSGGTPRPMRELYLWPQVLPDGKHLLYTVLDAQSGHHRARVVKIGDPQTAKDLLETDSRTMYAPSVVRPETGYLLYVRAGNILAQPFDPRSLRIKGEPVAVISRAYFLFSKRRSRFFRLGQRHPRLQALCQPVAAWHGRGGEHRRSS